MKVTIIGASLGGLFAAYHLSRGGMEVEVYERSHQLGNPPRTLIVTSKLIDILEFVPEEAILNRVRRFEIFSKSRSVSLELPTPDLVIERERLIHLLARRAKESGARIFEGYQFETFFRAGKKNGVFLRDRKTGKARSILTDLLIGADGVSSEVARTISSDGHLSTSVLQTKVTLSENGGSDICRVWFDSDYTRYFFWSIPESEKIATVGLIADNLPQAKRGILAFLEKQRLEPSEFQEAPVPLYQFNWLERKRGWEEGVFLIGDAAAHVKPTTVGGVLAGLYGAKALSRAILNGKDFKKELRRLRFELNLHLLIRNVLNRFRNEDYDELLLRLDKKLKLKGLLQQWTRDDLGSFFYRMIIRDPYLLQLGLKGLLRSFMSLL